MLAFNGGKLVICQKPTEQDIEVKTVAEYNLSKTVTSFYNYRNTHLICAGYDGTIFTMQIFGNQFKSPMKKVVEGIKNIYDMKPLMRDPS